MHISLKTFDCLKRVFYKVVHIWNEETSTCFGNSFQWSVNLTSQNIVLICNLNFSEFNFKQLILWCSLLYSTGTFTALFQRNLNLSHCIKTHCLNRHNLSRWSRVLYMTSHHSGYNCLTMSVILNFYLREFYRYLETISNNVEVLVPMRNIPIWLTLIDD